MKFGKLVLTLASSFMLFACQGVNQPSSGASGDKSASEPDASPSSNVPQETSSKTDSMPPVPSSNSSSAASSSSSKASSIEPADDLADYLIFEDGAPEIHFSTTEGADLAWATQYGKYDEKPKVGGTISTSNCDVEFQLTDVQATMKVRGNWTSSYTKKPFQINFSEKQNLFGLNGGKTFKKWVLLADVKDPSMLRSALSYYMGKTLMDGQFCTDFTPVHFYINDSYWGLYLLAEQKETGKGRVNINEPAKNYTGTDIGYFFEYDCYWTEEAAKEDGDPTFAFPDSDYVPAKITAKATGEEDPATGYTISSKIYGDEQVPFLKNHVKNCYTVLYNATFRNQLQEISTDPETGVESVVPSNETDPEAALAKTIDIDSFVNMYILNEICCDADVGRSSFYLSLDMSESGNKLLTLTNPWDWDSSLGLKKNVNESGQEWFASHCSNPWISILTNNAWFMQKVQTRWQGLWAKGFFTKALQLLDDYSSTYVDDYARNFQKYPGQMGRSNENNVANEVRSSYYNCRTEADAKALTKAWVTTRFEWLNEHFDGTVPPNNSRDGQQQGGGQGQGGWDWGQGGWDSDWSGQGGGITPQPVDDSEAIARAAAFKEGKTPVIYEAEAAVLSGEGAASAQIKQNTTEGEIVSGNQYLGSLNNITVDIAFAIQNAKEGQALISLRIPRLTSTLTFAQMFSIKVNGQAIDNDLLNITLTGEQPPQGVKNQYHNWTEYDVAITNLNAGNNSIVLTTQGGSTNFDYLAIYQAA